MRRVIINLSNKVYYTLLAMAFVLILGVGVYAVTGVSHDASELDGVCKSDGTGCPSLIIPSGAVMAFNLASCPSGWSVYAAGVDRMIIGSGSSYSLGATGGEATHVLTVAEMPSHTHGIGVAVSESEGSVAAAGWAENYVVTSKSAGGNQPHNNIPPYVALLYCVKN